MNLYEVCLHHILLKIIPLFLKSERRVVANLPPLHLWLYTVHIFSPLCGYTIQLKRRKDMLVIQGNKVIKITNIILGGNLFIATENT